jgi:hypothetical protein
MRKEMCVMLEWRPPSRLVVASEALTLVSPGGLAHCVPDQQGSSQPPPLSLGGALLPLYPAKRGKYMWNSFKMLLWKPVIRMYQKEKENSSWNLALNPNPNSTQSMNIFKLEFTFQCMNPNNIQYVRPQYIVIFFISICYLTAFTGIISQPNP